MMRMTKEDDTHMNFYGVSQYALDELTDYWAIKVRQRKLTDEQAGRDPKKYCAECGRYRCHWHKP